MWLYSHEHGRMRTTMLKNAYRIGTVCCVFLCTLLAACQIQALHSTKPQTTDDAGSIPAALRSIEIADPNSRFDQLVRNELQFTTSGGPEKTGDLPYTLTLNTSKSIRSVGISDVDFGPRAFFITISSKYILRDARLAAPIAQGSQQGTASYDRVDQEFANIRSERDAEIRAAKAAALRIRHALALALEKSL